MARPSSKESRLYVGGACPSTSLKEATEEEEARVEERYFADPDYLEQLQSLEDELLRDYVAGQLVDEERRALERIYFASPELRRRVAFTRAIIDHISLSRLPAAKKGLLRPA